MTPEEKEKLMNSVNKLNINNPVLNCRIKVRDKNGSPVSRNISIYMHYSMKIPVNQMDLSVNL